MDDDFDNSDVSMWIRHAIRRNARAIQLTGHATLFAELHPKDFVSRHLKILKLYYADVFDSFTRLLSSRCPCLEELELKDCLVGGRDITSVSLKRLAMLKCAFSKKLLVDTPNLVSVRCIAPEICVPLFKDFGALVTGSVMLDDSLLPCQEFEKHQEDDDYDDESSRTSDDDHDNNSDESHYSDDFRDEYSNDIKDNHDYVGDINSDSDTYEYGEIANGYEDKQFDNCDDGHDCIKDSKYHGCRGKYVINDYEKLGGQNVLRSLSSDQNLELLGHSGEVHCIL